MQLEELINGIPGFAGWKDADKIRFFAWFLHSKKSQERFVSKDVKGCYVELGLNQPSSISSFLNAMEKRKPKEVLHNSKGYILEKRVRDDLEKRFGQRPAAIQVDALLTELPAKIPNLAERTFLDETIICYKCKAFRAAIVMAWNLAYDHLCHYVLNKHVAKFNTQYPLRFQSLHKKATMKAVASRDDFNELKESEVIEICRSASIISAGVHKILNEKLGKRNTYAHPSGILVSPQTTEEVIIDLVNNVVLKLA
ncbi:MAG: hypothetical protein M3388_01245 [Acidobacteriota bacterium]|nr:hypothetical protein [Acidobacteriota bacterium]